MTAIRAKILRTLREPYGVGWSGRAGYVTISSDVTPAFTVRAFTVEALAIAGEITWENDEVMPIERWFARLSPEARDNLRRANPDRYARLDGATVEPIGFPSRDPRVDPFHQNLFRVEASIADQRLHVWKDRLRQRTWVVTVDQRVYADRGGRYTFPTFMDAYTFGERLAASLGFISTPAMSLPEGL